MKRIFILGVLFLPFIAIADQTGDCTAGEQYCEQNSLETTNTTNTNNTNNNNNVNQNNNVTTSTNSNTNVSTNTNNSTSNSTATNSNTNVTTSTSTANNNNVNSSTVNTTSTANSNNLNQNTNINSSTSDSTVNSTVNQTVNNTSTSNNTNTNINQSSSNSVSSNTNVNKNESKSESNVQTNNVNQNNNNTKSDNTNRNINESNSTQTINQNIKNKAPPASAIAPSIMSYSQDLCTVGRSGAFQGQVFGISTGRTVRDENCERLKLSKYLYDTGMKVASVAILCQDERVFKAMEMAGTPCPYQGKVGKEAKLAWASNKMDRPDYDDVRSKYISKCKQTRNSEGKKKSGRTCAKEFMAS